MSRFVPEQLSLIHPSCADVTFNEPTTLPKISDLTRFQNVSLILEDAVSFFNSLFQSISNESHIDTIEQLWFSSPKIDEDDTESLQMPNAYHIFSTEDSKDFLLDLSDQQTVLICYGNMKCRFLFSPNTLDSIVQTLFDCCLLNHDNDRIRSLVDLSVLYEKLVNKARSEYDSIISPYFAEFLQHCPGEDDDTDDD